MVEIPYGSDILNLVVTIGMGIALRMRILDEEAMLKEEFGDEWLRWHEKTARLVPGVF